MIHFVQFMAKIIEFNSFIKYWQQKIFVHFTAIWACIKQNEWGVEAFGVVIQFGRLGIKLLSSFFAVQQINSAIRMSFNQFVSKNIKNNLEIRNQSKEQFFSIKKNTKRLKTSNIFSQASQKFVESFSKNEQDQSKNDQLFGNIKQQRTELASTICSDHYLTFRSRQPKRKKNKKPKTNNEHHDEQSASENQSPLQPTLQHNPTQKASAVQSSNSFRSPFSAEQFLFISKIGEGTYSEVYKAVQKVSGFICSLKILNKQKMRNLKVEQNIFRQIKIHSFASHPHIAKLYGFFDDENYIYLILQYGTDENVYQHLNKNKLLGKVGLQPERVSLFVGQICSALAYMHTNFIIHRDIKPENMIITYGDTIKMCDFGWSVYNPTKQLRSTFCGTPLYLAPQLINSDSYDQSVDVWALGILTYELLTNEIPFKIRSIKDLKKVVNTEIKFTKIKNKQAVDFIEKALKKDTQERQSIEELFAHPFLKYFHQYNNI